jgi:hypothetical protein
VRKAKATPFVFIPASECKAWAKEIEEKRGQVETIGRTDGRRELPEKAPADRKNRKVRKKYLDVETKEFIRREIEDGMQDTARRPATVARAL